MDVKNGLYFFIVAAATFCTLGLTFDRNDKIIDRAPYGMPIVQDSSPITSKLFWGAPQEDRGVEFKKFLAPSVKIVVSGAMGSGTIVFHNDETNEAYVASCGHLWNGNRTSRELNSSPLYCKIITWYHNGIKLSSPREYQAQVLFFSNTRGYDCSLLKFTPDWIPEYFPIAPADYKFTPGMRFHSVGSDGGSEAARYDVEFIEYRGDDLITTRNSPRPGRSGGGLLSNDGYCVGICWGTSDTTGGGGIGLFTPLKSIYSVYKTNGYDWIMKPSLARSIPIIDMNNPSRAYPKDYVVLPGKEAIPIPR